MAERYKTCAIVLHSIAHAEKGHIAYLYTRLHGRVSYYIYGARQGVATVGGNKISLQPLNVVDIVGEYPQRGELHRMKEVKNSFVSAGIYGDILKSTLALYMSEFIYRIIRDREANPLLFDYIYSSIKMLGELNDRETANFHIYFTINISRFLGFVPSNDYFEGAFFDMALSQYVLIKPLHGRYFDQLLTAKYASLHLLPLDKLGDISLNREQRRTLLEGVIAFIGHHHETTYRIESLKVLSEIF